MPEAKSSARRDFVLDALNQKSSRGLAVATLAAIELLVTGSNGVNPDPGGIDPTVFDLLTSGTLISFFALSKWFAPRLTSALIWLGAASFAICISTFTDAAIRGDFSSYYLGNAPWGIVAYFAILAINGTVWSGWRLSRQRSKDLQARKKDLSIAQQATEHALEMIRTETRAEVNLLLNNAKLSAMQDPSQNNLLRIVDGNVRPLSHRLQDNFNANRVSLELSEIEHQAVKDIAIRDLLAPWLYLALSLLLTTSGSYVIFGTIGLVVNLAASALGFSLQFWLMHLPKLNQLKLATRLFLAILTSFIPATGYLFIPLLSDTSFESALVISFGFFLLGFAVTMLLYFAAVRLRNIAELRMVIFEQTKVVTRLQQERWVEQNRLAKFLHGIVQPKILSLALRAKHEPLTPQSIDVELTSTVKQLTLLDQSDMRDFVSQLDSLKSNWEPEVEIKLRIEQKVLELLQKDPVASSCCIEIIREGLSNAVKHADAHDITIEIHSAIEGLVLSIVHQGQLAESKSGFGSALISEVSSGWKLSQNGKNIELLAIVQTLNPLVLA